VKDIEKHANRLMDRELARRTGTSIFAPSGRLRDDAASFASDGQIHLGEYLHLAGIEWADAPFDSDHCQHLARLVEYIASLPEKMGGIPSGPLGMHEQKVLYAVAMLYCTGKKGIGASDDYAARSAANADKFFREGGGSGTYWGKQQVREEVCHLIYKHTDPREIAHDKLLQVFSDALRYETVRMWPNTAQGLEIIRERCRAEDYFTGWAKTKENFRAYMVSRGWK